MTPAMRATEGLTLQGIKELFACCWKTQLPVTFPSLSPLQHLEWQAGVALGAAGGALLVSWLKADCRSLSLDETLTLGIELRKITLSRLGSKGAAAFLPWSMPLLMLLD
ncbi:MAG: hypothetical protein IPJ73_22025 [Zoogloea sp.]|nr:hypothetical protein [Zoogloea sp.]